MIPIAAVVGAATLLGVGAEHRFGAAAERLAQRGMSLLLWVLLPPVAFFNIAALELRPEVGAGIAFACVAHGVTLAVAFVVGTYALRLERPRTGALMLAAAFANTGFLGLPFTVALLGFDDLPGAVAYDVLISAGLLVTAAFSVGAAFGTVGERPRERIVAFFARNPPLWAAVAGFLAPAWLAPEWAIDASRVAVLAMLPLGFYSVGVTLAAEASAGNGRFPPPISAAVAWAIALKLLVPAGVLFALSEAVFRVPTVYVLQAAMATGINNLVIAHAYGLDRQLVAAAIFWTTGLVVAAGLLTLLL